MNASEYERGYTEGLEAAANMLQQRLVIVEAHNSYVTALPELLYDRARIIRHEMTPRVHRCGLCGQVNAQGVDHDTCIAQAETV